MTEYYLLLSALIALPFAGMFALLTACAGDGGANDPNEPIWM